MSFSIYISTPTEANYTINNPPLTGSSWFIKWDVEVISWIAYYSFVEKKSKVGTKTNLSNPWRNYWRNVRTRPNALLSEWRMGDFIKLPGNRFESLNQFLRMSILFIVFSTVNIDSLYTLFCLAKNRSSSFIQRNKRSNSKRLHNSFVDTFYTTFRYQVFTLALIFPCWYI